MPTHYRGGEELERALNAYINFVRASDSLSSRLESPMDTSGLTMGQFAVLEALLHLGPLSQRLLCRKLLRSGGDVTIVVGNLEKRGFVRRERQRDDRRSMVVHLTGSGRRLIQRVFPEHARRIAREMARLTPAEQETLRVLCRKLGRGEDLCEELSKKREEGHGTDSPQ